ncbi:hypothetical protein GXP67_08705 [Rhodocytophaga rosea]|uniref:Uncharacterized protein n=1 Tax=Rhodocytophaga rosea TaxID=2704465 RepID=A0A6C0GFY1_9BACT|nr:hypothetical protein [Rhodocytophaga rosea]QHT66734.1 hypothetical protein GXP67_08705 [Rhodocytophaga rosea]
MILQAIKGVFQVAGGNTYTRSFLIKRTTGIHAVTIIDKRKKKLQIPLSQNVGIASVGG